MQCKSPFSLFSRLFVTSLCFVSGSKLAVHLPLSHFRSLNSFIFLPSVPLLPLFLPRCLSLFTLLFPFLFPFPPLSPSLSPISLSLTTKICFHAWMIARVPVGPMCGCLGHQRKVQSYRPKRTHTRTHTHTEEHTKHTHRLTEKLSL